MISTLLGCQSSFLKLDQNEDISLKSDLDKKVVIEETLAVPEVTHKKEKSPPPLLRPEKKHKEKIAKKKKVKSESKTEKTVVETSDSSIEDQEGFIGRRPVHDPFHVGEKLTFNAYYNLLGFSAGTMTLETLPFVQVNGRKAYQFVIDLKTSGLFNSIYSIEDRVETLIDYELWLPRLYNLHVKETSQLREGRMYFDFQNLTARYEEKKVTKKKGVEEKKQEWTILPYSQNVFSVIYYMRLFAWRDGQDYAFRVADDNQNLIFKGQVVGRETLNTDIGQIKAVKIKPQIILKGSFKPVGDIYIWLSDDERHIPLRIESKIKIGKIVLELTDYQPGQAP